MMQKMFIHNRIVHLIEKIVFSMEMICVRRCKIVVLFIVVFLNRDVRMQEIGKEKDVGMILMENVKKEHVQKNYQHIQLKFVKNMILVVFILE